MSRQLIPNSTQIPDVMLDAWMAQLSGAEFKVLLYVARRTYGFGKDSDRISLSQMADGITKRDGTVLDFGTGLSRSSVARSLKTLVDRGIVFRETNLDEAGREFEESSYRINLHWPNRDSGDPGADSEDRRQGVVPKSDDPRSKKKIAMKREVVRKSDDLVRKPGKEWSDFGTTVVPISDLQETDQETVQETAAADESAAKADAAVEFSELVKKLVANGVGHTVAKQLARSDPDGCRRHLAYLPFAHVKKSRGAFLANAIRDGYGPPKGYEEATRSAVLRTEASNHKASRRQGAAGQEPAAAVDLRALGSRYADLRDNEPQAFASFLAFRDREKSKIERIARQLSEDRGRKIVADWEGHELELFDNWLRSNSKSSTPLGGRCPPLG